MNGAFKWILIGLFIITFTCLTASCTRAKTFNGRVIDADTKEPIEGAVVVVYWYEASWIPFGEWIVRLKDVKETLTEKNGEWTINGPAGSGVDSLAYHTALMGITFYTREPEFIVFKPSYCSWPNGFSIDACKGRIHITGDTEKMIGKRGTLELPKLTNREDRIRALSISTPSGQYPPERTKELVRLINEERRKFGLGEISE